MQETSALYKELLAGVHTVQTRVTIGDTGLLVDRSGDYITFAGTRILVASSAADGGYDESMLAYVETNGSLFDGDEPSVGSCISREVDIKMLRPSGSIYGMQRIGVYARLTDGERYSEWLPQGVYYLDSADEDADENDVRWVTMHGYDAMMFAEQDYPEESKLDWPATDVEVLQDIADTMGVSIDSRTWDIMTNAYPVQYTAYSCREYLSYIAAMYAGAFIMNELGELRLVCFWNIPKETNYLIDNVGYAITIGGVRILV